jgi:hypothetical protein
LFLPVSKEFFEPAKQVGITANFFSFVQNTVKTQAMVSSFVAVVNQ